MQLAKFLNFNVQVTEFEYFCIDLKKVKFIFPFEPSAF